MRIEREKWKVHSEKWKVMNFHWSATDGKQIPWEKDEKDFGKMSKVHEIVKKVKQMEPVYLGEIVAC